MNRFDLLKKNPCVDEKVEDTKGVIRSHKSNTTDKTTPCRQHKFSYTRTYLD
jgi:hypothetical protein